MKVTYNVTITVSNGDGTLKTKLLDIPRESIFEPGYPPFLRQLVEFFELHIHSQDPEAEERP